MTAGDQRSSNLRAMSQASFSDLHSIGSASSPRRSRFFGFKNLSSGWRSSDSLAPSGSMIDMQYVIVLSLTHLSSGRLILFVSSIALAREEQYLQSLHGAVDIGSNAPTLRVGEQWPQGGVPMSQANPRDAGQSTKKAKGFKKIWKIVTGAKSKSVDHSTNTRSQSVVSPTDDGPLDPPPPLSYLVNRERGGGGAGRRHVSTPSLPTAVSPNPSSSYMPSPPTAPSSIVPSPTSSRPSGGDDAYRGNGHISSDAEDRVPSGDCSGLPE